MRDAPLLANGAAPEFTLAVVDSPVGPLTVAARGEVLVMLRFGGDPGEALRQLQRRHRDARIAAHENPAGAVGALRAYFAGDLLALDAIAVDPGGTPFQQQVWGALRAVPAGRTASYAALARAAGFPSAIRAAGAANGANPIAIVLPCHRIIGSSGRLVGYGGGLDRKRWLLQHEGVLLGL